MEIGIGLIIILMMVSGLIAYLGDLIGRRVGKRRVSILGLRPKHASILITIVAGVVIVSLTLGVLLGLSKQARKAFFGLKQLQNQLLEKEYALTRLEKKYSDLDEEYRKKEQQLEESIRETKEALEETLAELEQTHSELDESHSALEAKQSELDGILGEINFKSLELSELQEKTDNLARQVKALDADRKRLEETRDRLEKRKAELEGQIEKLKVEHASAMGETGREVLFGDIIYQKDEPLARTVISPDMPVPDVEERLAGILSDVFAAAVERGAVIQDETSLLFQQQMMSLLDILAGSDEKLIVEVRSHNNVFKGQPLYVTLNVVDNEVIYREGEILGKEIIDPGLSQAEVGHILNGMLGRVSAAARAAGMVPNPESGRVGSVPVKRYVEVVKELAGSDEARTVEMYSEQDARLSDSLKVDFRVF